MNSWRYHAACAYNLIRTSRPLTRVEGPKFRTTFDALEIDVTFRCNLKCLNCDRSCSQAPDNSMMTIPQVEKFVRESVAADKRWARIRFMGGEPMLHGDIFEIVEVLDNYRREQSPATNIEIATNGFGDEVNDRLRRIPEGVRVVNSRKTNRYQEKFDRFNLAPCDKWYYFLTDFVNACWVTRMVGFGLNRYGYYHCAAAGSIDRVLGFDMGIKKLPGEVSAFDGQKRNLCKYCGHFPPGRYIPPEHKIAEHGEPRSKKWAAAYQKFAEGPPVLTPY
jgi:hypothetical protein